MFKLYDLNNTKIFNTPKELINYCLRVLCLPARDIMELIAVGYYHGISLEFI